MKKIGILTFHRFINYGGLLQAYALCRTLNELNTDTYVIDYTNEILENVGNSKIFCKHITWKRRIKKLFFARNTKKKEESFHQFIQKNIKITKQTYTSIDELEKLNNEYDLFITGSDQVWNPKWPYEPAYFLDFVKDNQKKVSYGASLGDRGIPEEKSKEYQKRLKTFWKIAVREQSDQKEIEKLIQKKPVITVDPVLLLSKEQWEELIQETPQIQQPYCLIYTVNEPKQLIKQAKNYAQKNHLDLIYLNPSFFQCFRVNNGKKVKTATPQEFLKYFHDADAVFTNSFHGTVFSYLFEKNFYVETQSGERRNKRAADFLSLLELEPDQLQRKQLEKSKVIFESYKEQSMNYLYDII